MKGIVAKKTSKNQITLPKAVARQLPDVQYFEIPVREGEVVLRPAVVTASGERLKTVRTKMRALGLRLSTAEIRALIEEEILPFVDTIRVRKHLRPPISDQDDHKFLECAVAGHAEYLVTGDKELRALGTYRGVTILNATEFLSLLGR